MSCETEDDLFPQRYEVDYVRVYQLSDQYEVELYGDVNLDGTLNIIDIVMIVSFILNDAIPSENQTLISDSNQDGDLDILDVIMLVSQIVR
jgi:hypothetical protein